MVEAASEKQAVDILLLDTRNLCSFADYFVICTGESSPQIEAICQEVDRALKEEGVHIYHREGANDSGWVLLDYGDVIVHVFAPTERAYFQLEKLWSQAPALLRIQ